MNNPILLFPILFPIACGAWMFYRPFEDRNLRNKYVGAVTLFNSIMILLLVWFPPEHCVVFTMTERISLALRMDGMSRVFATIVSVLWPIAVLYSFDYMKIEHNENRFFAFYTMTYGVVMGIATAENYFTLYLFYELLTLATLPLVMHEMDPRSRFAGKRYILYSMSGAAMAFIAMVIVLNNGSLEYVMGGAAGVTGKTAQIVFLLGFFGFGATAAIFPLHAWLPTAGVAPTPVTALLHAVAVVNAGLFAILRLIYFCIGAEVLAGTTAQMIAACFASFTVIYGSFMAVRNKNVKRKLAFSTISNLSYILIGAVMMSPAGLTGALMHMVMHSVMKIELFFCAGAMLVLTHHKCKTLEDYEGLGQKVKIIFGVYSLAAFALIGMPPFCGFSSKWSIFMAAMQNGTWYSILGVIALCVSAFLTGIYLWDTLIWALWPRKDAVIKEIPIEQPGKAMKASLIIVAVLILLTSIFATQIYGLLGRVAGL